MISNDPINVLCNWEGEERERGALSMLQIYF